MILKVLILSVCLILLSGCAKKKHEPELKYTPEEFDAIMNTTGAAPSKEKSAEIDFTEFSPGVNKLTSKPLVYERLNFAVIEFETEKQARDEALRLNQYYSRNWLFDKVEGEPILEDLVLVKFKAENPKRHLQRKPVNIPPEHAAPPAGGEGGAHH
ncbi:MAG: hypothetical protein H7177_11120 [Rhizobacter sp.]|nr:hypothetical protein [Bacteriovorax sp.]